MSLREKLEKVHSLLINEDKEEAAILFHEAFVEAAREVHTSIMEEEDWLEEDLMDAEVAEDEIESQENESEDFGSDPVLGEEGEEDEAEDFGAEEVGVEDEAEFDDVDDEAGDDIAGEIDVEGGEEHEGGADEIIADLEDDLERLKTEFANLSGDDEGEESLDDESGDDEGTDDENYDTEGNFVGGDIEGDELEGEEVYADESVSVRVKESDEVDEDEEALEEVDELDESFELESVEANNTHDHIGSGGEKLSSNNKSVLPKKRGDARDGDAVKVKSKNHSGYNKETPPTTTNQEKRKNVRNKAAEDQSSVSKDGDSSALLNKDHSDGYGAENVKSPIGSKGSKTTKGLTEGKAKATRKRAAPRKAPRKTK